jgi:hypothetical protein
MSPALQHSLTAVGTAVATALASYTFGVAPVEQKKAVVVAERNDYAANSQLIRDELKACLGKLEACWRECR